jgi:hypothetical protein
MRARTVLAYQRCARRAEAVGLPVACAVNPFARPQPDQPLVLITDVLMIAARVTGVSIGDLIGPKKRRHITMPRQFACWLVKQRLGSSWACIGHAIGRTPEAAREATLATEARLSDDWPLILGWRNRAAEMLSRLDTTRRPKREQ